MVLALVIGFIGSALVRAGVAAPFDMPGAGLVLEMRRAHVVDVFCIERAQRTARIERPSARIVGAEETVLVGVVGSGFVEIQVSYVVDRQLVIETQAVGRVEFHGARVREKFRY